MNANVKISSFTDLHVWQEGHKLVIEIYRVTEKFPKSQQFSLVNQMQRCVISVTSNIAEGFSRRSNKEKIQFYFTSLGSLTELQNQLLIGRDLGYILREDFTIIAQQTIVVSKLLHGLIKSSRKLNT